MRGDFSRWQFQPRDNFNGVLPQQGKLSIDADGLAQTRIANYWQQSAARDWVGPVAAVPADEPAAFQITNAIINADGSVTLTVGEGRIWADGLLVEIGGAATVARSAWWLEPPIVPTQGSAATAAGQSDIVVLEVWQEGINGYQLPKLLIEPALGGPDTAERLHTATAFKLARLTAGQTCKSIAYNNSGLGKLTVSLQPATVVAGDCPLPAGGGYSGFEHALYRIEIADVNAGSPSVFKFSRENGGLAGRGTFSPGPNTIAINANLVAITTADVATFYVEIEQWDTARGNWQVVCGGNAAFANGTLTFANAAPAYGAYPAAQGDVFFRLWEGTAKVSDYPIQANPKELEYGIFLQFDPDAANAYRPRDYWVFPVRAGGIANPQTLIDAKPPEGIVVHRVPLAEITWDAGGKVANIQDCRATIVPLTSPRGCCSVQVGDGLTTFAQFTSIQQAINSLPPAGGEVCILAGRYFESINLTKAGNVSIHGCGQHTRLASPSLGPKPGANSGGVITFSSVQSVELRSLIVEAADGDSGVSLAGDGGTGVTDVVLRDLIVVASDTPAIWVSSARDVMVQDSVIAMRDVLSKSAAVFASGQAIHISGNWVGPYLNAILPAIVASDLTASGVTGLTASANSPLATCGIQIAGNSSNIFIRNNEIAGGAGNGVSLGAVALFNSAGARVGGYVGNNPSGAALVPGAALNFYYLGASTFQGQNVNVVTDARFQNLHIENNHIRNMGLCGIGPIGFFNLKNTQEVATVTQLWIVGNHIESCLNRTLTAFADSDSTSVGYGGICLPDVTQAYLRDNLILNTGASLSDPACGIFVLHAELIEITRNQILDNRNWTQANPNELSGYRAGISVVMATPIDTPGGAQAAWNNIAVPNAFRQSLYAPDAPAVRIEDNVVDVPAGLALVLSGLGAFSIRSNHFSTGGATGLLATFARCVQIFNFGTPIEYPFPYATAFDFMELFTLLDGGSTLADAYQSVLGNSQTVFGLIAPGPVDFSQNRCSLYQSYQLKSTYSSVWISTFDDLLFSDNQCLVATNDLETDCDAFLTALTIRAMGCRFQEMPGRVYYSALTFGFMNITTLNQGSNPLAPIGPPTASVTTGNIYPGS